MSLSSFFNKFQCCSQQTTKEEQPFTKEKRQRRKIRVPSYLEDECRTGNNFIPVQPELAAI